MGKHLQASFARHDDNWVVAIESGQGQRPVAGNHVTAHTRAGKLKRVTIVEHIDYIPLGRNGKHVSRWAFVNGWQEVIELEEECEYCGNTLALYDGDVTYLCSSPECRAAQRIIDKAASDA